MDLQNPRIVLGTGVLKDEKTWHVIWLFFRLVDNKNLSISMPIFKNCFFFVKHNNNIPILTDLFWSAVQPFGRDLLFWSNFWVIFSPFFARFVIVNLWRIFCKIHTIWIYRSTSRVNTRFSHVLQNLMVIVWRDFGFIKMRMHDHFLFAPQTEPDYALWSAKMPARDHFLFSPFKRTPCRTSLYIP